MSSHKQVRVLYSFPHRLGAGRICHTAWHQVTGLAAAGAQITVHAASLQRSLPPNVDVYPTLSRGRLRVPFKLVGKFRALALHDYLVSRRVEKLAGQIDIIHTWPMAALRTLKTAARLGIPTVLERPNAHTQTYYEIVQRECESLGIDLPPDHEHTLNPDVVRKEEEEYRLSYRLLCPSDFVVRTFLNQGFKAEQLARHGYGYDEKLYFPNGTIPNTGRGLTMLFVGICVPAKGLHYALEAWLQSPVHRDGIFKIAGEFLPAYAEKLSAMLSHPSVQVLGHRNDVAELMRNSDILVLPSLGEGFGLVCADAMGSGTVPLVSDACTDICKHMDNALVHRVGDSGTLARQITELHENRTLLQRLRASCLKTAPHITWTAAGARLLRTYCEVIAAKGHEDHEAERHQLAATNVRRSQG
jgi:glycosyltransferase involved in cell wall biosynthesis